MLGAGLPAHAAPATAYRMPFPCGQDWTGTTRGNHSPSSKAIDWNRAGRRRRPGRRRGARGGDARPKKGSSGYGNYVRVEHENGETSLYAHLSHGRR